MFDNELRNEKQIFNSLASKVNRLISQYDAELSKLKKRFETINGSAEKEINKELMQLKSDLDRVCNRMMLYVKKKIKMYQSLTTVIFTITILCAKKV